MKMKRSIIIIAAIFATAAAALAQPKSVGIRLGATGLDATYQHTMAKDQFIEADAGLDFGYNANGRVGFCPSVSVRYRF